MPTSEPNFGPCLYLGPSGERCLQPAREDGVCARHSSETEANPWLQFVQRVGAILLLVALLWPLIAELLQKIAGGLR